MGDNRKRRREKGKKVRESRMNQRRGKFLDVGEALPNSMGRGRDSLVRTQVVSSVVTGLMVKAPPASCLPQILLSMISSSSLFFIPKGILAVLLSVC